MKRFYLPLLCGPLGSTPELCLTRSLFAQLPVTSVIPLISSACHAGHKHPNVALALTPQILCRIPTGVLQQKVSR